MRDDIYDKNIQMVIEKLHRIHWIFDALQIKCIYLCQPKMSRMDINGHGRPEFWRFNGNRQRFHRLHILNLIENIMKPSIHVVPKRDPMATLNRLKTSIWILLMSVYTSHFSNVFILLCFQQIHSASVSFSFPFFRLGKLCTIEMHYYSS